MIPTFVSTARAAHPPPTGAAFDVVLLLHVACVVVGLGTVVVSGVQGARLLVAGRAGGGTGSPGGGTGPAGSTGTGPAGSPGIPSSLVTYFAPGVNWVGRVLYAVPLLGFALLGMSGGVFRLGEAWVLWGLGLWVVAVLCAEGLLWPAERRIQALTGADGPGPYAPEVRQACQTVCLISGGLVAVLVLAIVLMVAQP